MRKREKETKRTFNTEFYQQAVEDEALKMVTTDAWAKDASAGRATSALSLCHRGGQDESSLGGRSCRWTQVAIRPPQCESIGHHSVLMADSTSQSWEEPSYYILRKI